MGKNKKRKKDSSSSSGSESEIGKGEGRGPAGGNTCPVSTILSQANSVLFENNVDNAANDNVFNVSPSEKGKQNVSAKKSTSPSNADIFKYLQEMNNRLVTMETKLQTLDDLKSKVDSFEKDVKKLWTLVNDQHKMSMERLSAAEERIDSVEFSQDQTYEKVCELESANKSLKDEIVYLQSQSMRNNLVFANIEEDVDEDPEKKLREFMVNKLNIAQDCVDKMIIERAHRMGGRREGFIRSIVAKFNNFKDKEFVRRQSKALKGTHFFVNEQYPKEISDKRRALVPKMKEARQEGKRSWISYDTLYIDGRPVRG